MADTLSISYHGDSSHDELSTVLKMSFERALRLESCVSEECLKIHGMSGIRYRMFINNVIRMVPNARYLEIGSWAGSTACSAMDRNVASITCIDNWSEFGGPKTEFLENIERFSNQQITFKLFEDDFKNVDAKEIGTYNVYLFDGPHTERDQYDGLHLYECALDDNCIFIVDDWNWDYVRNGTLKAIKDTGFSIDFSIEIRSTLDNSHAESVAENSDWHNGYFISKISKRH